MSEKTVLTVCGNCGAKLEVDTKKLYSNDIDFRQEICGEWTKRKPNKDGVLNLTEEEKIELSRLVYDQVDMVRMNCDGIEYMYEDNWYAIYEVQAILWLAERFNLTGVKIT